MTASKLPIDGSRSIPTQADYQALAAFRLTLRRFYAFSEAAAIQEGLTPQQHQALLAIKGISGTSLPSIGDVAEQMLIRHHSAVELINRLEQMGLVRRVRDADDGRKVRVALKPRAEEILAMLSVAHLKELESLRPLLMKLLRNLHKPA
ncbi:MarR family transcriptional regulator [Alcaligenaceae bacterium]|nr:MarR family transcriptional regulator [Alcaligenaceae bacterium]